MFVLKLCGSDVSNLFPLERMSALLPDDSKERMSGAFIRRDFDLNYRLDCQYLFADFKENLEFRFSLGLTSMMERFLGPSGTKAALVGFANVVGGFDIFCRKLGGGEVVSWERWRKDGEVISCG